MSEQSVPWHHQRHFLINFPRDAQLKGEWAQSVSQSVREILKVMEVLMVQSSAIKSYQKWPLVDIMRSVL